MTDHPVLADGVAILHAGFVAFVLIGFVLILSAGIFQWQWARHRSFRVAHLAAVVMSLCGLHWGGRVR